MRLLSKANFFTHILDLTFFGPLKNITSAIYLSLLHHFFLLLDHYHVLISPILKTWTSTSFNPTLPFGYVSTSLLPFSGKLPKHCLYLLPPTPFLLSEHMKPFFPRKGLTEIYLLLVSSIAIICCSHLFQEKENNYMAVVGRGFKPRLVIFL